MANYHFHALNKKTIGDAFHYNPNILTSFALSNIIKILDQLGSVKYFNVFNLASDFH